MLRFFLDKFRESPGPLKQARVIAGDLAEEVLDIAEHYIQRLSHSEESSENASSLNANAAAAPSPADPAPASVKKTVKPALERTLDVSGELAGALDAPSNQKKQEFKVLAILWDAKHRNLGDLSAKQLSEHGEKLGLAIRHENVRKIIRMRLENYVDTLQDSADGTSIYHYHITPAGEQYFKDKYLK
jgi:hypothetical protein